MNYSFFIFVNFIVSFMSDIFLNDIANKQLFKTRSAILLSLQSYFKEKSIIISASAAGLTVILCLIITSLISKLIFNYYLPNNLYKLFSFNILAFIIGYIADILIDRFDIFGRSLHKYYQIAGAGFWGAFAFIVSINVSYLIIYMLCKFLEKNKIC